jgi:galactofuranosylgalactofuranosylrhamnosyl-N-acetylglucosaminyl-diphospho-decaprenol beta-1,5/1,6-galactofuranosyltransferase
MPSLQPIRDGKPLHPLQELQFPGNKLALELYVRILQGYAQVDPSGITLEKDAKVSFNTWFNSFYESWWLKHTALDALCLELDLSGTALVEVYREIPGAGVQLIEWNKYRSLWETTTLLPLPLAGDGKWGAAGRLFVEITAESDVVLAGVRFKTSTQPRQTPLVSVQVDCAGAERLSPSMLAGIASGLRDFPEIQEVLVEGPDDDENLDLSAVCATEPKLRLIKASDHLENPGVGAPPDNDNAAPERATHVIRVDGAATFERANVRNLLQLLTYASPDITLAAHTLDRLHPWLIWSAEDSGRDDSTEGSALPQRADLRTLETLSSWTICSQPASQTAWMVATGLSATAGNEGFAVDRSSEDHGTGTDSLLAMPGISVWHSRPPWAGFSTFDYANHEEQEQMDLFPLQDVLFADDKIVSDLYCRNLAGHAELRREGLLLERDAKVSFNTYFNSFYESYWNECAPYGDLYLELELNGRGLVEIFRDTKDSGCQLIQSKKIQGMPGCSVAIPVTASLSGAWGERGRLFVDFTAEAESTLQSLRFSTNRRASTEASFTLGICTFNREPWLLRNLRAILEHQAEYPGLKQVIVVNQGPSFRDPELAELASNSPAITVIEQRNLGGCGGFTRTMHESLNGYAVSHHVLMDDDTTLDARVLGNLNRFLAYASPDLMVGGHMLDSLRPCVLYEAGAMVRANSRIKPLHHNVDLRPVDSLIPFNRCHYPDYNAWWFCAIPTQHMRAVKYPAPIFIRGDDMEYGLRLGENGVKTVALPGIAVWHEPFYAKVGGWQLYYDLRNRLIMAAVYPHRFQLESPRNVLWTILRCLALHDYMGAALFVKAVQDFLRGPSLMETDAEVIHTQVTQLTKDYTVESVRELGGLTTPVLRPEPKGPARITLRLVRQFASVLLGGDKSGKTPVLLMDSQAHPGNVTAMPYVKTNGAGTYKLLYRPSRERLRQGLAAAQAVFAAYKSGRNAAAAKWREQIPHLRGQATWEAIFSPHPTESTSVAMPVATAGTTG